MREGGGRESCTHLKPLQERVQWLKALSIKVCTCGRGRALGAETWPTTGIAPAGPPFSRTYVGPAMSMQDEHTEQLRLHCSLRAWGGKSGWVWVWVWDSSRSPTAGGGE